MTDSIDIPTYPTHSRQKDKQKAPASADPGTSTPRDTDLPQTPGSLGASTGTSSNQSSSYDETRSSDSCGNREKTSRLSAREKGKTPLRSQQGADSSSSVESPSGDWRRAERRASLLSSSISKSEHTVVNIGDPDRPRLITCVKASQGFDWNQDIFLPSYISERREYNYDLEHRQDPVQDIFITDEEAEMMFPR